MSPSLHFSPARLDRLKSSDSRNKRVAACVRAYMNGLDRDLFKPGAPELNSQMFCRIAHLGGLLYVHRAIHGDESERELLDLLKWLVEQKKLLVCPTFLQGLFIKSIVLFCDSLGERLPAELEAKVLERLTTLMVDIAPNGLAPTLDIPGIGFHLLDEQINNWDSLGAMGLIYLAMLSEKVHAKTTPEAKRWLAFADRRFQ